MTPAQRASFERLLKPRHIAFVGGADALVAIGEARRRGYDGQYWPVNPSRSELGGLPCFESIAALPEAPDAVFLAIPAARVPDAVKHLAVKGAGGIVCYSAGFRESGAEGARLEQALKDAIGDMILIGPNCYGLINYIDNVALWPFAHGGGSPGYGAAIVTQSGMFSSDITMSQRSLPLAYMISAGNQTVNGIEDFVDLLCGKPEVRAIGLHIEGLQDVARFERIALRALECETPIVALKTGTSAIGSALAVSHTGSLAGSNELYEALFERTGIVSVTSPAQLLETLKYLCVAGAPKGPRIAGFTCSGGGAAMLADHAETIGLSFPDFDAASGAALRDLLPAIATVSNPLDYTTPIWGQPEFTAPVFAQAMQRDDVDSAILVQDYPAAGLDESKVFYRSDAAAFADAAVARGLPAAICATIPENIDAETRELLLAQGIVPMQGLHETLNAVKHAADWSAARDRLLNARPAPLARAMPFSGTVETVDEAAGKAWLAESGLPVPRGRTVTSRDAAEAAAAIGYPVALKMMSPRLPHKTEAGAVALGITGEVGLSDVIARMRADVARHDPVAVTDSFLVEAMCPPPLAELIVGIRRDPQFGFAMTLGSGGILVELLGDASTLLLPATSSEIRRALDTLKVARLLRGYRGREAADLDTLAQTLAALGSFVLSREQEVEEVEINPLFVYPDHVIAADVLLRKRR